MPASIPDAYELWDLETGALINVYLEENKALAAVRRSVDKYGPASVAGWALVYCYLKQKGAGLIDKAMKKARREQWDTIQVSS